MESLFSHPVEQTKFTYTDDTGPVSNPGFSSGSEADATSAASS